MNNKIFSERHLNKVNQKLLLLGSNDNRALPYLTLKAVLIFVPCVVLMFISIYGLIAAPFVFIFLYILTDYVVINREIKRRQIKLEKDGLLFFKVLYFNYINNRNLKVALKITTNNVANDLSKEFKKALDETDLGKNLYDALNDLEKRIPSNSINAIITNINEAILLGNDAEELLKKQIHYLELNEINYQDKMISKIPIKVAIAFILIILPIILVILSLNV